MVTNGKLEDHTASSQGRPGQVVIMSQGL